MHLTMHLYHSYYNLSKNKTEKASHYQRMSKKCKTSWRLADKKKVCSQKKRFALKIIICFKIIICSKIIICFKCWFWKEESNNCSMLSWMNPCYLQSICNLTEFVSHSVTPGSLKRVLEKYAKRCALESVQKWSFPRL